MKSEFFSIPRLIRNHQEIPHYGEDIVCFANTAAKMYYPTHCLYLTPNVQVLLIEKGEAELVLNGKELCVRGKALFLHGANYLSEVMKLSEDIRFYTLSLSENIRTTDSYLLQITAKVYSRLRETGSYLFPLTDEEYELLSRSFRSIVELTQSTHSYLFRRLQAQCNCLFLDIAHILQQKLTDKNSIDRKDLLLKRFYELLILHFREEHYIAFYARQLCITEQYLSRIVKGKTTRTVNQVISELLIIEAQRLLVENKLPIKQISELLSFNDTTNFSSFFKRHLGMTPSEYCKNCIKAELPEPSLLSI